MNTQKRMRISAITAQTQMFVKMLDDMRTPLEPIPQDALGSAIEHAAIATYDRDINIAIERVEEAMMWAIKHVTGLDSREGESADV